MTASSLTGISIHLSYMLDCECIPDRSTCLLMQEGDVVIMGALVHENHMFSISWSESLSHTTVLILCACTIWLPSSTTTQMSPVYNGSHTAIFAQMLTPMVASLCLLVSFKFFNRSSRASASCV